MGCKDSRSFHGKGLSRRLASHFQPSLAMHNCQRLPQMPASGNRKFSETLLVAHEALSPGQQSQDNDLQVAVEEIKRRDQSPESLKVGVILREPVNRCLTLHH